MSLSEWITSLRAPQAETRRQAAQQLCQLGEAARPAAVTLVIACGDSDQEVVEWLTAALEQLGPPEPAATGELAELLAAPNPEVSYWAATLLGRLGPPAASAALALGNALLHHPSLPARERAAWALGKIGPPAGAAREALAQAARGNQERLARLASSALQEVRPPQ